MHPMVVLVLKLFQVKLPDDVMLEADTTLTTLAPIIKSGGVIPERYLFVGVVVVVVMRCLNTMRTIFYGVRVDENTWPHRRHETLNSSWRHDVSRFGTHTNETWLGFVAAGSGEGSSASACWRTLLRNAPISRFEC